MSKSYKNIWGLFEKPEDEKKLSSLMRKIDDAITYISGKTKRDGGKQKNRDDTDLITGIFNSNVINDKKPDANDINNNNISDKLEMIFKDYSISQDRLIKYKTYDELYDSLSLMKSIIKVYTNNITQNDSLNNKILFFRPKKNIQDNDSEFNRMARLAEGYNEFFEFDEQLKKKIIPSLLRYGDYFVEIVDLHEYKPDYQKYVFQEDVIVRKIDKVRERNNNRFDFEEENVEKLLSSFVEVKTKYELKKDDYEIFMNEAEDNLSIIEERIKSDIEADLFIDADNTEDDLILEVSSTGATKKKVKSLLTQFGRVFLKYHTPHNIIPVVTGQDTVLGYLEVTQTDNDFKDQNSKKKIIDIIRDLNKSDSRINRGNGNGGSINSNDQSVILFVRKIIRDLIKSYKINNSSNKDKKDAIEIDIDSQLISKLEPDLYFMIKRLLYTIESSDKFMKLDIRFIQKKDILHYSINESGKFPYGTSVIDPLVYPGKLYLLTQQINIVTKFSRSALIRKWTIDTGDVRTNQSKMIQKLTDSLRNSKISADSLFSNNGMSMIPTDFRDMIQLSENGEEKIKMDILQHGDPNIKIQDLEDLRRELVAISGIPSSMMGLPGDSGELREQLIHSNIRFSTEIQSIQNSINRTNTEFFNRIHNIISSTEKNQMKYYVNVGLMPPSVLLGQLIESGIQSSVQVVSALGQIQYPVDTKYFLQRFCPWVDWDEVDIKASLSATRKATSLSNQADQGGGY